MIPVAARIAVATALAMVAGAAGGTDHLALTITAAVLAVLWLVWAVVDAAPDDGEP